ncbi:phytanoyl-CoA dioxygenase family protein, partial [Paenibacillus sepulcri]|nr:phytanoyl-CoA dioxygenase family protein [Paenibacillus sepulcri]
MNDTLILPQAEDQRFFDENGYWISPKIIDDDRLGQLRAHMELVHNGIFETGRAPHHGYWKPEDGNVLRKTDNSHWADPVLRGLAADPLIGHIAALLMKADAIALWHDQLLYKPGRPRDGQRPSANVGWHQDYSYWR